MGMDIDSIEKNAIILGRLDARTERIERDIQDFGKRIEALEEHQNKALGAIGLVGGSIGALLWGLFQYLFHLARGGK